MSQNPPRKAYRYSSTTCSDLEQHWEDFEPLWEQYCASLPDDEREYVTQQGVAGVLTYADLFVEYERGLVGIATLGGVSEVSVSGPADTEFVSGVTDFMLRRGARKCKARLREDEDNEPYRAFRDAGYIVAGVELDDALFGGEPENVILMERLAAQVVPDTVAKKEGQQDVGTVEHATGAIEQWRVGARLLAQSSMEQGQPVRGMGVCSSTSSGADTKQRLAGVSQCRAILAGFYSHIRGWWRRRSDKSGQGAVHQRECAPSRGASES